MARFHHDDIFSPVRFDTSLADSSINSIGSIANTSNIEGEMCLSFKDAREKCVFEVSDEKSAVKEKEMELNNDSFGKTTKSEKSQLHGQSEVTSRQDVLPGAVQTVALVEDIFSPVRFDTSLVNSSINSEGNTTSTFDIEGKVCLPFKDAPYDKCVFEISDVKSVEKKNEMGSSINTFEKTTQSENRVASDLSLTPKKDLSMNLVHSKKLTSDLKFLSIDKRANKEKNISVKKSIEIKGNQNEKRGIKQNSSRDSVEINEEKNKKPARPTSLLSTQRKMVESNSSKDIKKNENKIIRKSASSKNANDQDVAHKKEFDSSEKNYLNRNISDVRRNVTAQNSSVKQASAKNRIADNLEKDKSKKLQECLEDSKATPNLPLQTENLIIEKIVHDHVSFECDKIRQNIYSHQMSFYRELNKIKDEMGQQHLVTTERLFKMIEELMHLNVLLKEKL